MALRARDEFLAVAAHELRNPMHALLLQVATMRAAAERGEADLLARLAQIETTVDRYVRRAAVLLDVSRISAGRLTLDRTMVDYAAIVRETAASFQGEAAFARSELNVTCPPELIGWWDQVALEQIVTNLVSNAVKYGAGGRIAVGLTQQGQSACLSVSDEGVGIPAEDLVRIFERFEQVVTRRARSGFGVGLWLVRELVEAHGGSIEVVSTVNKGSTFKVQLPIDAQQLKAKGG
jgi:signal transduction histidine kinase